MSDTPKFSLLSAARSQQNAKQQNQQSQPSVSEKTSVTESKPVSQPIQQSVSVSTTSKTGLLGTKSSLLGGAAKTQEQPKNTDSASGSIAASASISGGSLVQAAQASKGGLLGGLEKARAHQETVKAEHDKLFMEPPKDFRELLDSFDKFFREDTGISEFDLAPTRDFVERIFNDLRTDPSLDGLMKDKDIANVIEWVSKVKGEALAAGNQKKEKAEKKAGQVKAKARFGNAATIDFTTLPGSIKELSDFGDL